MVRRSQTKKIVLSVVLVGGLLIGIFVLSDYLHYKHGNRSHFFGSLSVYKQNETLHYNQFDVWVTEVERRDYPKVALIKCSNLPQKPYNYKPSLDLPGFIEPNKWRGDCLSWNHKDSNYDEYIQAQTEKNIIVHFFYKNTSKSVASLDDYKFKLVSDSHDTLAPFKEKDRTFAGGEVLPETAAYANISVDIDKGYNGPLSLVVSRDGVIKNISLSIPTKVRYWP